MQLGLMEVKCMDLCTSHLRQVSISQKDEVSSKDYKGKLLY